MNTPPPPGLDPLDRPSSEAHRVAITRWSVVGKAADASPSPARELAREHICRSYWYPLYVYLRRQGKDAEQAEEFVQGFFLELFEKNILASADPDRGKFRTFLLTALIRYVSHCHRDENAQKRGGHLQFRALDTADAEHRYHDFASRELSPEAAFDRAWAISVLQNVLKELEQEFRDRKATFEALRPYLTTEADARPYQDVAQQLGTTQLNVKVMVHRLRARYRRLLDDHLRSTVDSDADLEGERQALFAALAAPSPPQWPANS